MKKVLTLLLVLTLLTIPFTTALAADISFTLGDHVNGVLDTNTGVLTISGTGDMYNYDNLGDNPLLVSYDSDITSVIIESGVTRIGNYGLALCNLESVTISDTVSSIGDYAFSGCEDLATITNNYNGNQTIEIGAFNGCGFGIEKTAYACYANTTFITAITDKDYLIEYLDVTISEGLDGVEATVPVTGSIEALCSRWYAAVHRRSIRRLRLGKHRIGRIKY